MIFLVILPIGIHIWSWIIRSCDHLFCGSHVRACTAKQVKSVLSADQQQIDSTHRGGRWWTQLEFYLLLRSVSSCLRYRFSHQVESSDPHYNPMGFEFAFGTCSAFHCCNVLSAIDYYSQHKSRTYEDLQYSSSFHSLINQHIWCDMHWRKNLHRRWLLLQQLLHSSSSCRSFQYVNGSY